MARKRHSKPEVEKAIQYAEALGWRVEKGKNHAIYRLYCPHATRAGCQVSVWSTPKNPGNHARQIRAAVDRCPHQPPTDGTEQEDP